MSDENLNFHHSQIDRLERELEDIQAKLKHHRERITHLAKPFQEFVLILHIQVRARTEKDALEEVANGNGDLVLGRSKFATAHFDTKIKTADGELRSLDRHEEK